MRNVLKAVLILLRSILIFIFISYTTIAIYENISEEIKIERFKAKGVLDLDLSTDTVRVYKISSSDEKGITFYGDIIEPGYYGDILLTFDSNIPLISGPISFYAGGHSAICTNSYQDSNIKLNEYQSIESTMLSEVSNEAYAFDKKDVWDYNNEFNKVIGIRSKMTNEDRLEVVSNASAMIGDEYNLFGFKNTTYCSDLCAKAYEKIGYNLNKDGMHTSVHDLINSSDTYISYYHFYDNKGIKHIYYLG